MDEKEREVLVAEAREWVQEENWESGYEQDGFNRPGTDLIARLADALAVLPSRETQSAHPEGYCHRCGGKNLSWAVENDLWNAAMRPNGEDGRWGEIICPACFAEIFEKRWPLTSFFLVLDEGTKGARAYREETGTTPSREIVAPTEEEIAKALHPEAWGSNGNEAAREWARKDNRIAPLLALFPGEGREAVEAAQRERDAQIAEDMATPGSKYVAAAIREAGR